MRTLSKRLLNPMQRRAIAKAIFRILVCIVAVLAVTVVLYVVSFRDRPFAAGMFFLFLVLIVSAVWGLRYALLVSFLAALAFSWLAPPVGSFLINDPRDVLALFAFLFTGILTSYLSDRARKEALNANQRRAEAVAAEKGAQTAAQLAQSHVEVMMRSVDVLVREAAPEKFIGEMLRTIGKQLGADRLMLWLRNIDDDSMRLHVVIENDQQVPPDPNEPGVRYPHAWKENPFVREMLFTKCPLVIDEIEHDARVSPDFRKYLTNRGCKKFLSIPMFVSGEVRGFIGIQHAEHGAYRENEIELAQALAHHVILATHGQDVVERQREAAILKERTRMARDIHDTLAQGFTGVILQMEAAEGALLDEDPENAVRHVRRAGQIARESLGEARRSVHALRPEALEKTGFADALKAIIQNTTAGTSLRTDFHLDGEPRHLPPSVEENLLRIGQEALSNALKHAHPTQFQARLSFDPDVVRLELWDDGKGFVLDGVEGSGIGLVGMKERAEQIGGTLTVISKPGAGTRIVALASYNQPSS